MIQPGKGRLSLTAAIAVSAVMLSTQTGCGPLRQFREGALPSLESGIDLILDGLVDGLFAAIEVETP